ncbi:MAG TPA: hypothetical protein VNA69_09010 [Thermoanaerobaculia bacterium]|nr:hypothetical protein [Thermoanaerobaculia bacterium]
MIGVKTRRLEVGGPADRMSAFHDRYAPSGLRATANRVTRASCPPYRRHPAGDIAGWKPLRHPALRRRIDRQQRYGTKAAGRRSEPMNEPFQSQLPDADMQAVPRALMRAARRARAVARQTGTAVVVVVDGKRIEERVSEDEVLDSDE